ncbi:sugar ABC transporter substrate-binding protein [Actinoplanes sp. NPDC049668]|uniref:sugar ABC transporter substrate-binding protein n=1 Tax=unclassified Actinoplanes TaxID=2626549 RepID=UPI00339E053B
MTAYRRRLLAGVGVLCLGFTAVACGGDDGGGGGDEQGRLSMGIAVANVSLNFAIEMSDGATQAAADDGNVDFQVVGPPDTDGPAEVQLFQNLVTTAQDGVILENLDPPLFTRPAAEAIDSGVPVIALDTAPTDGSKIEFYVGNDNYDLGALMATELLKHLSPSATGTVVVGVPNPGTPVLDNRAAGIKETLNAKAPGIKVLGPFQTYSEPTKNYSAWSSLVSAHGDALAFLGVGDADSYDLARLKQEKNGRWLTAGFDVDDKTLQAVKDGTNFTTIDPEHYLKGYLASAMLIKSVRGELELPKGWFVSPGLIVTKENVDDVIQRGSTPAAAKAGYQSQIDSLLKDPAANTKPMDQAR